MNKSIVSNYVRHQLLINPNWAIKAMVKIYELNQLPDEKASQTTSHLNGIGFSGTDARILSSFVENFKKYGRLSPKQMVVVHKLIPKYVRQVISLIPEANLPKLEQDALNHANLKSAIHTVPTVERDPELDVANP
jgi:hypothetical protein